MRLAAPSPRVQVCRMPAPTTRPAVQRLFAAIVPDAAARAALAKLQREWLRALQDRAGMATGSPPTTQALQHIRLVPPGSLHLTLRFFGATPGERLAALVDAVAATAERACPSAPQLQRIEHWPPRRPGVVVATTDTPPALAALAADLEAAARALGLAAEPRAFRAHVTLARCRGQPLPPVPILPAPLALPARALVLFESHTLPEGARYTPIRHFPLQDTAGPTRP